MVLQKTQAGPYYMGLGTSLRLGVTPHEHEILGGYLEIELFREGVPYPTFRQPH